MSSIYLGLRYDFSTLFIEISTQEIVGNPEGKCEVN